MPPNVNFKVYCQNLICTAENVKSTTYNVGSIYFKRKSKKLNSGIFICHQFTFCWENLKNLLVHVGEDGCYLMVSLSCELWKSLLCF